MRHPGIIASAQLSAGSGGGGDAYVASAVNFDGNTVLKNLTVAATDSRYFFMSLWVNHHALDTHTSQYPFIVDPVTVFAPSLQFINNGPSLQEASWSFYTADYNHGMQIGNVFETINNDEWYHYLVAVDTFAQTGQVYKNDIPQSQFDPDFINIFLEDPASSIVYNGVQWQFGGNVTETNLFNADIADVWIHTGDNMLATPDTISEAHRRLFISADGKPVNPSVAVAALGSPVALFSGDATGFATNQGSGGAFTVTGSLTTAPTSPSD
jgi:hypothetical protein